jgi:hypothetical protein
MLSLIHNLKNCEGGVSLSSHKKSNRLELKLVKGTVLHAEQSSLQVNIVYNSQSSPTSHTIINKAESTNKNIYLFWESNLGKNINFYVAYMDLSPNQVIDSLC